ncbi:MAG: Gfo/Idh/MocA family oxidoreductase [Pirellulaceae bacterium]|nr:Gfo/Idh/MocA family oxidoreductase [Pirellulaceae bacterium]
MSRKTTRRRFMQTSAAIGAGYWALGGIAPRESRSAIEKIHFACIGVGGKGSSDSNDAGAAGDVVAICDIDEARLDGAGQRWPEAKKYHDFRTMYDEMGKNIDAVTVSTPDHTHAVAAAMGMRMGKHAFVQKPMTKSLHEARVLGQLAAEKQLATQMGNQGTANNDLREAAAILKSGALGKVKEVHVWTNRPVWPQGDDRPTDTPEVPKTIHWKEFIGPAEFRPYHPVYHPFKWRGWWAFGTGALGDMACHTLNMPYMGLDLRDPTTLQAVTSGHNKETYPSWSIITMEFPERNGRAPLTFKWYDGKKVPTSAEFLEAQGVAMSRQKDDAGRKKLRDKMVSGCFVLGDKGWLLSPGDYAGDGLYMPDAELPKVEYPRSPGHFKEWVNAIKGGEPAMSNFPNYATPLTETVLLGNLAVWVAAGEQASAGGSGEKAKEVVGKKIEWDAKNLTATNAPEVAQIVKPELHNGYVL